MGDVATRVLLQETAHWDVYEDMNPSGSVRTLAA